MPRTIKSIDEKHRVTALDLVEKVLSASESEDEGKAVRRFAEEIRSKEHYVIALGLIMTDEDDDAIGYALFSHLTIEGRYGNAPYGVKEQPEV